MNHFILKFSEIATRFKKSFLIITFTAGYIFCSLPLKAAVTITKASGGTGISADRAANASSPSFTALGNIILTEGTVTDFSTGTGVTFTMNAPAGWTFNPFASVSVSAVPGGDIISSNVISISTTLISIQLTVSGNTNSDVLTISGIEVRANEGGNIPGSGNITRGGSAVIAGCLAGANLGSLTQAFGVLTRLVITMPGQTFSDAVIASTSGNAGTPIAQTAGTAFTITKIRACDQFYNVVTSYSGVKALTYSGPSNGLTAPTYVTNVSFASGVSSTALTTTLKKAETTAITVTDGINPGQASSAITVNPGVVNNFLLESSSGGNVGTQITGISFDIRITARDANNNHCTSGPNVFSGTTNITSSGTLTSGGGTTPSFSGGILASHSVTLSSQGNFILTATKTGGGASGNSNSFAVNYPPGAITSIIPSCITPGSPDFTLSVNGFNFSGTSVVRFNGSDRTTTFISANLLLAEITASDIATPGIYSILVYTPGNGNTAPVVLNTNTESTANVSICQGNSYLLPDGSLQNTSGTYLSVIPNVSGCDSTITTNLSVNSAPGRTENITICPGSSYTLPDGSIQNTPGTYISLLPNPPGCDSVITTNLSLHQSPVLFATPVQIDCYGNTGSVILNTINGLSPYTYGPQTTTNLTAGTYNFSVTDANGCTDVASSTIDPQPSPLTLTAVPTQITCNGGTGSVILNASGGTPSYSFNSTPVSGLIAGTYNYQVMDNNGCTANASATINTPPPVLSAVTTVTNTPCGSSTGSATANISGGVSPYSYLWNTIPVSTTRIISGLVAGNYTVTATDNNGCTISKTATVINSNSTPLNISGIKGICPGGTTTLCASAGFASYFWNNGETNSCITVNTADTFIVTVTDSLGCSSTKSIVTNNSSFPSCTITGGVLCLNGSLILRAPTGYANYLWSNNIKTSYNTVRNAGTYSVTVKNSDGCASTCSYTVNSPLRITVSKTDGKCSNEYKGTATVTANAGIPPYTYQWSNGATTASITGLSAGSYTVRVTDAGGCSIAYTAVIYSNITTNDYSTVATMFNSTPISIGSYIWFNAMVNFDFTGNYPVTLRFRNQNISSSKFSLTPANATLIITNAVSQATTTFSGGEWVTTAPPDTTGNYFIAGYAYPVNTNIPASLNPVKWKGVWLSSSSCVTRVSWKWSAAVYSNFTTDHSLINVKPVDNNYASQYNNNDLAGTPDNFTAGCIAGALGMGGMNFTGTHSVTGNRLPCSTTDVCPNLRLSGTGMIEDKKSGLYVSAYPNPFSSMTQIEFMKADKSGFLSVEIFSFYGQKLKTIFEGDVEIGIRYTTVFDATELADGIYIYRFVSGDEEVNGKLLLQR